MVTKLLRIHLEPDMLARTVAGQFNFMNRVRSAVEAGGWRCEFAEETDTPPVTGYALHHMSGPSHPRTMFFRKAYYYPYWHIEPDQRRWRWPVATAEFEPGKIPAVPARQFLRKLRQRILPGLRPGEARHVLIPLQEQLLETRSFQSMSPVEMVEQVASTGKHCIATLHPKGNYTQDEMDRLARIGDRYPNFTVGENSRHLIAEAEYIATQNSAVAFEAYLLARPVVLFAQVDFHHIALNVPKIGVERALRHAPKHKANYAKYLYWFLRRQSIVATAKNAEAQIIAAMRKGGWPI